MGKNGINRAGDTSQRCGNSPAVSVSGQFVPKSDPPEVLDEDGLLALLASQGFIDANSPQARYFLRRVGYTHAKPYSSRFSKMGAGLATVSRAIRFDRQFQSMLLEYIGLFELQFRAQYAHLMAQECGPFAHRDPSNFKRLDWYERTLSNYADEVNRQARQKNQRVREHIRKYGDLPIWEAVEVMSMGTLSKLYKNTRSRAVRFGVADAFGVKYEELVSWLGTISFVRNRCAHFGRLLGTKLVMIPKAIPGVGLATNHPLYAVLILERLLSTDQNFPDDPTLMYSACLAAELNAIASKGEAIITRSYLPPNWRALISREDIMGTKLRFAPISPRREAFLSPSGELDG